MIEVAELWRYPVKGLGGERLERLEVGVGGAPGDRLLRIVDERGTVTGRRKQRMVGLEATLGDDGEPLIAGERWDSEAAAASIRTVAGETARVERAEGGHAYDAAQILLISDGSIAQLGYDRRRFRPNILVGGCAGPVEQGWIGGRARIGDLLLAIDRPCERCVITTIDPDTIEVELEVLTRTRDELDGVMGVYCSVLEPGFVSVGDRVAELG